MKLGLVVSLGLLLVGGGLSACGGSDDSSGGGGTSTGGTSSGGTSSGGTSSGGSAGASSGGTSSGGSAGTATGGSAGTATGGSGGAATGGSAGSSGDPLAECKAQAASNPNPACANCACDNCLNELQACEADPTCVALRNCAQTNNCCDEFCVLLSCGNELTAAGGIGGPGANKAIAVRDCTETASCNCCGN
jgi:hypothetical protein